MKRSDAKLLRKRLAVIVRKAIDRTGKKKSQVAQEAGISSLLLSKILSSHGNPSEEALRALGKVLWGDEEHIKKDKILQRITEHKEDKPSVFALNLKRVLEEKKITRMEFSRQVGVTPTVVSLWLKAGCEKGSFPSEANMAKITKLLGLSASKLKSPRLFAKVEASDGTETPTPVDVSPEGQVPEQEQPSPVPPSADPDEESALDWEARCRVLEAEIAHLKRELIGKRVAPNASAPEPGKPSAPAQPVIPAPVRSVVSELVNVVLDIIEQRKHV